MLSYMRRFLCCAILLGETFGAQALAQTNQAVVSQKGGEQKVDAILLTVLIKSSLIALEQANSTGNYSVVRDLGTPAFREKFDQASLSAVFTNLRSKGVSLNPILVLAPNLTKQPEITPQNQLHLVGSFPTQPLQIQYELWFIKLNEAWRIEGISVDAVPAQVGSGAGAAAEKTALPTAVDILRKRDADKKSQKSSN
jgi:hypothetical protein